jgi:hypothetical protein
MSPGLRYADAVKLLGGSTPNSPGGPFELQGEALAHDPHGVDGVDRRVDVCPE